MNNPVFIWIISYSPCFLLAGLSIYALHRVALERANKAAYKKGVRDATIGTLDILQTNNAWKKGGLTALQETIHHWHRTNFPNDDARDSLLGIGEELGEVMRTQIKQSGGIRGTFEYWQREKEKEVGDVLIGLINYCAWNDIHFLEALVNRWAVIGNRDYIKYPEDGGRGEHEG